MPFKSPLHERIYHRLVEAFGPPDGALGRDDHWRLYANDKQGFSLSINLLVNGSADIPAIWVFDPYDHEDGVLRAGIRDEEHLEEFIAEIEARLNKARKRNGDRAKV